MEDLATTASSNLTSPRVNLTFEPINPQQNLAEGGVFESIKNSLQSLRVIDLVFCSYKRVSMGWWLLRLSAKILALLRLSVNFFQLRLTKKLKINFFCFKKLNIN